VRKIQLTLILLALINLLALSQNRADSDSLIKPYGEEAFNAIQEFFKYDKSIPLNTRVIDVQEKGTYKLEKFVFTNSSKDLVPGYLAIPKLNKSKYPCMILLHAGAGSKDDWWSDGGLLRGLSFVNELLASGYAVMALDAEAHGERAINSDFISIRKIWFEQKLVYSMTDIWVQSTMDYRKAADYIMKREEIDSTRIGVMGYSMGGAMAAYLCTQVPQIKVSVMCSVFLAVNEISPAIYPLHFIPRIPDIPVLLLEGNKDEIFHVSQAKQFERLLKSNKKKLILYESGHFLPKEYLKEALEWIRLYL
jgi:dienelactone hydrolase